MRRPALVKWLDAVDHGGAAWALSYDLPTQQGIGWHLGFVDYLDNEKMQIIGVVMSEDDKSSSPTAGACWIIPMGCVEQVYLLDDVDDAAKIPWNEVTEALSGLEATED